MTNKQIPLMPWELPSAFTVFKYFQMEVRPLPNAWWWFSRYDLYTAIKEHARIKMMKLEPLDLPKLEASISWRGKDGEMVPASLAVLSGSSLLKLIWGAQPAVLLAWRRRNQRAIVETTKNKLSETLNPNLGKISVSSDTFHASYVSKSSTPKVEQ